MKQIREFLSGKDTQPIVTGTLLERLRDEMSFLHNALGLEVILESEPEDPDLPHRHRERGLLCHPGSLTNVTRHSHASKVEIHLKQSAENFAGFLSDNGVGFDRTSGRNGYGVGLTAMEERIKKLGGELVINSTPGREPISPSRFPYRSLNPLQILSIKLRRAEFLNTAAHRPKPKQPGGRATVTSHLSDKIFHSPLAGVNSILLKKFLSPF